MLFRPLALWNNGGLLQKARWGFPRPSTGNLFGNIHLFLHDSCLSSQNCISANTIASAVCLEQVNRSEEIRELKCLHVFHRECLEKWYLGDHYNCPLCHRPYFVVDNPPRNDYVWMVWREEWPDYPGIWDNCSRGPRSKLIDWRDPDLLFTLPSCEHLPTIIMTEWFEDDHAYTSGVDHQQAWTTMSFTVQTHPLQGNTLCWSPKHCNSTSPES